MHWCVGTVLCNASRARIYDTGTCITVPYASSVCHLVCGCWENFAVLFSHLCYVSAVHRNSLACLQSSHHRSHWLSTWFSPSQFRAWQTFVLHNGGFQLWSDTCVPTHSAIAFNAHVCVAEYVSICLHWYEQHTICYVRATEAGTSGRHGGICCMGRAKSCCVKQKKVVDTDACWCVRFSMGSLQILLVVV